MTVAALADDPAPASAGDRTMVAAASVATDARASLTPRPDVKAAVDHDVDAELTAFYRAIERRERLEAASRSTEHPVLSRPASGAMTGWFGERRGHGSHVGMDLDGETGDPIVAAGPGVVEWAGPAPAGYSGYGLMVLIRHSSSVQTLYAHLSRIHVAAGDAVESGDSLGKMGTTGNVTGSHLHFEVRVGGRPVNPADWLSGR